MLTYVSIILISFFSGYASGYTIHQYMKARQDYIKSENAKHPVSRILKPFVTKKKLKPKVNNDEKAWMIENGRAT